MSELDQVIVGAYSGANRFLWPKLFVNRSTVPYCIAMEKQKQNEMVCAQNLINSRNYGWRKPASTMVNERQRLRLMEMVNQQSTSFGPQMKRQFARWCRSHCRALDPSRDIVQENSHSAATKTNEYYDKTSNRPKSWLDNDRQQWQTAIDIQQSTKFY